MFDQILSILFPEHCYSCHRSGTALCGNCIEHIPHSFPILESLPCFAFFNYSDRLVQRAIRDLKYHHRSGAAKALTRHSLPRFHEYLAYILQSPEPVTIIIVPVPQHYTKTLSRGFNQSNLIAQWLQKTLSKSSVEHILHKKRTLPQAHTTSKQDRMKNVRHSMTAKRRLDKKPLYIIVDDVITTGSTVQEASRALRAAGARNICAVAIAHGYANPF